MTFTWKDKPVIQFDNNMCRLCADISNTLLPIFDVDDSTKTQVDLKIKKCLPSLMVSMQDYKPKQICVSCFSKLNVCNELFDLSIAAESKFNTILTKQCFLQENKNSSETCVIKQTSNYVWPSNVSKEEKAVTVHDGGVIVLSKVGSDVITTQNQSDDNRDFVVMVELKYKDTEHVPPEQTTHHTTVITGSDLHIDSFNSRDKLQSLVMYTEDTCAVDSVIGKDHIICNNGNENYIKEVGEIDSNIPSGLVLFGSNESIEEPLKSQEKCFRLMTSNLKKSTCDKPGQLLKKRASKSTVGKKVFVCSTCNKQFQRRTRLNSHMAVHTQIRPHSCNQCDESFVMRWDLTLHQRIHSKIFECDYCKKIFTVRSKLDRHRRTHTGEKPYACDYCCKAFVEKRNLDNHLRTHTGEKPYVCDVCDRAFRVRTHLTDHQRVHTRERPFRCDICGKLFRWKANYNVHVKGHKNINGDIIE